MCLPPGPAKKRLGAFLLTTRLLVTKMTWLVMPCVKFTLRAMIITATPPLRVSPITILSILRTALGLRVEAGLLNRTTPARV